MTSSKVRGVLLDVDYSVDKKAGKTFVLILIKELKSGEKMLFKLQYNPYLLVRGLSDKDVSEIKKVSSVSSGSDLIHILNVEKVERFVGLEKVEMFKIEVEKPSDVPKLKHFLKSVFEGVETFEFDIPFRKRAIMDLNLLPMAIVEVEVEGDIVKSVSVVDEADVNSLKLMSFDIEVYNPEGSPDPSYDPVIMISYSDGEASKVMTTKSINVDFVDIFPSEKAMIESFSSLLHTKSPDVLFGYNSSQFDIPYLIDRSKKIKAKFNLSFVESKSPRVARRGLNVGYRLPGIVHFDIFPVIRLLANIGTIPINRFTLYDAYSAVVGKEKVMVDKVKIWEMWDSLNVEDIKSLAKYSKADAEATFEIGRAILPLEVELSRLSHTTLFDTTLSTMGQLVENRLMAFASSKGIVIPRKPKESEVKQRFMHPYEGAYVKLPSPGIYENIVVFDFRGLYPSIIISYNIDPSTIVISPNEGEEDVFIAPTGYGFKKEPKGMIPTLLKDILKTRFEIKRKLKSLSKDDPLYKKMYARQQALKILANSFYGYMGYPRSRWYSRECASSITALGRKHIMEAERMVEEAGLKVLYIDTDSLFILLGDKPKSFAIDLLEKINKTLPEEMELELENFYVRGIFVSKRGDTRGAKKKYALLAEDGSIKIRGFELVRRDWSNIAKVTQKKVLEILLKEGSRQKAVDVVRNVISDLRRGNVPLEDLIIYAQLNKDPSEYEVISPELAAAMKMAKKRNIKLKQGMLIPFIISKKGKSISDKAVPPDMADSYDADYYIHHQVLPAVMKILSALDVDEDELLGNGKQSSLSQFFG